jgi:hypothetical protein
MSPEIAGLLTRFTTVNHHLAVGAPTSSLLANLTLLPLVYELDTLANANEVNFSIAVDDLAFSGLKARALLPEAIAMIRAAGHAVPNRKVKVMSSRERQLVTGLGVNSALSVPREKLLAIEKRIVSAGARGSVSDREHRSISGQLAYVESVSPKRATRLRAASSYVVDDRALDSSRIRWERRRCKRSRACLAAP